MDEVRKELFEKQERIRTGGGIKKIEKQHSQGKMTARERIERLLDPKTFTELDMFVTHRARNFGMDKTEAPGDGVVTGYGTIHGRLVYIYAQDFTVLGGSLGEMHAKKICKILDMAMKMGAPIIGINDSGGARIQEGVDSLSGFGQIFSRNTQASGVIPQIAVIMGPCAGGAVYSPALMDFTFMVENTSQMFITGPQVIKEVTGEEVSQEALGGALTHNAKSGVAHFISRTEGECLDQIKELLQYLPSNNMEEAETIETADDPRRPEDRLQDMVPIDPNKPYDIRDVIRTVVDEGKYLEVQQKYAENLVVCFARIAGKSIGIIANQPKVMAGCLDINASDKAARFIRFCDAFNIPIVNFVDVPGFLPGIDQEHGGIIRHGAKMLHAYVEATVPKITVVLRKAYGGAYIAMCSKDLGADQVFAWPRAEIAVMGPEGAASIIFRKNIEESKNPAKTRRTKINEYRSKFANPQVAAQRGYVDVIIDPSLTRPYLANALEMLMTKRETRPAKKHSNIPL